MVRQVLEWIGLAVLGAATIAGMLVLIGYVFIGVANNLAEIL